MRISISKTFDFDATHTLPLVPDWHKCAPLHGHNYHVELVLKGWPGLRSGVIIDYADIEVAWMPVHSELHHRHLNDISGLKNPTTEALASWLFERLQPTLPLLSRLRVYESSTTWCEVRMD